MTVAADSAVYRLAARPGSARAEIIAARMAYPDEARALLYRWFCLYRQTVRWTYFCHVCREVEAAYERKL